MATSREADSNAGTGALRSGSQTTYANSIGLWSGIQPDATQQCRLRVVDCNLKLSISHCNLELSISLPDPTSVLVRTGTKPYTNCQRPLSLQPKVGNSLAMAVHQGLLGSNVFQLQGNFLWSRASSCSFGQAKAFTHEQNVWARTAGRRDPRIMAAASSQLLPHPHNPTSQ